MRYHEVNRLCRPDRRAGPIGMMGCPYDGLGCTGGEKCSINSTAWGVSQRAYNAEKYGPDFICQKRESAKARAAKADKADGGTV